MSGDGLRGTGLCPRAGPSPWHILEPEKQDRLNG